MKKVLTFAIVALTLFYCSTKPATTTTTTDTTGMESTMGGETGGTMGDTTGTMMGGDTLGRGGGDTAQ